MHTLADDLGIQAGVLADCKAYVDDIDNLTMLLADLRKLD